MSDSVVIAVMGMTGTGKSSFIKRVTGRKEIQVGHDLDSETADVKSYKFVHQGINFILVDTPGFDDSRGSDRAIMEKILVWLNTSYREGTHLNGLLYLHRIVDPRLAGTAYSNLKMFRSLCGADNFKSVILATTFWGQVRASLGESRERELGTNNDHWGQMITKGAKIVRLKDDRVSNLELLLEIAKNNGRKVVVEAQKEMLAGKKAAETAASRVVNQDLERYKAESARKLAAERKLHQDEIDRRARAMRERIEREQAQVERERLERVRREQEADRVRRATVERARAEERRRVQAERERMQERERQLRLEKERGGTTKGKRPAGA